jgi:peptide/nickel transport system substrate-binding protein
MKVDQKPFDDPRVRMAMKLAIDPAKVLELAHAGLGLPAEHHHVCPIHPEYAKLPAVGQDTAKARALLAEAGYPDGLDLEIACRVSPAWELSAVEAMVPQWDAAGIRVKINNMPSASYWDIWDKVPFGFTEWIHRPLGTMVLSLAYRSGVPWNESGYANPEFDALLTKAEGLVDIEERRQVMAQLEEILQQDGPIVQPLWRSRFGAYDKRVLGFRMHPTNCIFAEELAVGT